MSYIEGDSIESLARAEPALRNTALGKLIELTLLEFLRWGAVQSDPNFANFRFNPIDGTIGLIDSARCVNSTTSARRLPVWFVRYSKAICATSSPPSRWATCANPIFN